MKMRLLFSLIVATILLSMLGLGLPIRAASDKMIEVNLASHVAAIPPSAPPTRLTLSGPVAGAVGVSYLFTANLAGGDTPINYTWEATEQSPVVHLAGESSDMIELNWRMVGTKIITVTAANSQGTTTTTYEITLDHIPLDIAVVFDVSGSMFFETTCFGCWESNGADVIANPWPSNGVFNPLPLATTQAITPNTGMALCTLAPTPIMDADGNQYLVHEAELYSENGPPEGWQFDRRQRGQGFWVLQRANVGASAAGTTIDSSGAVRGTSIGSGLAATALLSQLTTNSGKGPRATDGASNLSTGCTSDARTDLPWQGIDTALLGPNRDDYNCAIYYAREAANANVSLFIVGIGPGVKPDLLTAMATGTDPGTGDHYFDPVCGRFFVAAKPSDVAVVLREIVSHARTCSQNLLTGPRYVAVGGVDSGNTCTNSLNPCATVQHAVDVAQPGETIKVAAGTYTGVNNYGGLAQMVYLSKTVTLQGGYTPAFIEPPDPQANPTILDAQSQGRVLYITGNVSSTIEGFRIMRGDSNGLWSYIDPGMTIHDTGGGIYVTTATVTIRNNELLDNQADWGGGIHLENSTADIIGNTILSNTARVTFYGRGGGLFMSDSNVIVSDNIITDNLAGWGGGINSYASLITVTNNLITSNNVTAAGGGVYLDNSTAIIEENTISSNKADNEGGGIVTDFSHATFRKNTITANKAINQSGGGLFLIGTDQQLTLIDNIITDNTAAYGGGLFIASDSILLINTIIAGNQADVEGDGVYVYGSSLQLLHTTLAYNGENSGNGIYVTNSGDHYSELSLKNTILVSHTVGISVTAGNTADLESTLWFGNGANWSGAGSINTTNNYSGDPAFVGPNNGDYRISSTSAAINKGVAAGVATDIEGELRDAIADLGADEQLVVLPPPTPTISSVSGYVFDPSQSITIFLENHPNTQTYDIWLYNSAINQTFKICDNVSTDASGQATIPCSLAGVQGAPDPGIEYELFSTIAGQLSPRLAVANEHVVILITSGPAIPPSGGTVHPSPGVTITIDGGVFSDTIVIIYIPKPITSTGDLGHVGLFYDISAVYLLSGLPALWPAGERYTITLTYDQADVPVDMVEADLALYYWDGSQWQKEPTSQVDVAANTLTATPDHFSLWAALGPVVPAGADSEKLFLPTILKQKLTP